jgi:hypothetical protein
MRNKVTVARDNANNARTAFYRACALVAGAGINTPPAVYEAYEMAEHATRAAYHIATAELEAMVAMFGPLPSTSNKE